GRRPRPALSTGQDARRGMDRNEKKRLRERIGEDLDVSGARLTDDEALQLADLVDNYENYRGQSETRTSSYDGWSSDGKYTREVTVTHPFTDEAGIRTDSSYRDDDGKSGGSSTAAKDARGILHRLRDHRSAGPNCRRQGRDWPHAPSPAPPR